MSTPALIDHKAAQSQELLQILLSFSVAEIANLRRLLSKAEALKLDDHAGSEKPQRPRRFIDPDDGGPVWELGFIGEFDRWSCYENTMDET